MMPGWAQALNEKVEKILPGFVPTISNFEFNRDLSFSFLAGDKNIKSTDDPGTLPLSRGTLDQLYLGIRLAVCKFLSGNVRLPVILDEPFAHTDEDRFVSGMNALCELAESYGQIIILSCHRLRHKKWMEEMNPKITLLDLDGLTSRAC